MLARILVTGFGRDVYAAVSANAATGHTSPPAVRGYLPGPDGKPEQVTQRGGEGLVAGGVTVGQLIQDGCAGGDQHEPPQLGGVERIGDVARPLFGRDPCGHLGDVFAYKGLHSGGCVWIPVGNVEHRQPGDAVFAALRHQCAHDIHHVLGAAPGGFAPPSVGRGAGRGHRGGGQPECQLGLARKVLVERRT
ncbi:hypothetical protein C1S81_11880 [Mycolicibacterium neoaurum]|nr:hypothetical protein C1S81_11880 [Mycolicibacterium neoaurum]